MVDIIFLLYIYFIYLHLPSFVRKTLMETWLYLSFEQLSNWSNTFKANLAIWYIMVYKPIICIVHSVLSIWVFNIL